MKTRRIQQAAFDTANISGLTHTFYKYPARFAPSFASAAIKTFSKPGSLVLDPFMGGGTTIIEALVAGRRAVGTDINSLALFVATVKSTPLTKPQKALVKQWATDSATDMHYRFPRNRLTLLLSDSRTRNLDLPQNRAIKKAIAAALKLASKVDDEAAKSFARAIVLKTAQWALDNRTRSTELSEFRQRLLTNTEEMLIGIEALATSLKRVEMSATDRYLFETDAANLSTLPFFAKNKVDLVVASPPYPGIHVLYDRWQVDGRRESPAPYWIAECHDGHGASYYTFGDRKNHAEGKYFECLLGAMKSCRAVMRDGGKVVQMVAFSNPARQLRQFLRTMESAGFTEWRPPGGRRIWRDVPNRKWHATAIGKTPSSREVVLIHAAA